MESIELEIVDIDNSKEINEAYALILKEKTGERFFPVLVGFTEARAIVLELNKIKSRRPTPHDLFKSLSDQCGTTLLEVFIYEFAEGVFYSKLIMQNKKKKVFEIDSRTSDAIALSLKYAVSIFIDDKLFNRIAIYPDQGVHQDSGEKPGITEETPDVEEQNLHQQLSELSIDELNRLLEGAVESEDFELASQIHDEIERRNPLI